ncbi:MAG: Major outer membrane porin [Chlamydiales bacterium]|nr:Major outer membrane porin [Chlamydiales bacterium]
MKKLVATALTILSCGAAYALPLGNPSEASLLCDGLFIEGPYYDTCQEATSWCDAFSIRLGYYGDFVFNRHLEVDSSRNGDDIEDTEIFTNAAYVAFNWADRVDVFATFGATNLCLSSNTETFISGPINGRFKLETETDFSWSIGARATLFQCGCTSFGIEGQYFYTKPDVKSLVVIDQISGYPSHTLKAKYQEWQVGAGVSHRIWNFVPYLGAKLSGARLDLGDATPIIGGAFANVQARLPDLKNRFNGGFVLGVSFIDCERMALTAELRFPDEKALYVNGQVRF